MPAILLATADRSPLKVSRDVHAFTMLVANDAAARCAERLGKVTGPTSSVEDIAVWASDAGLEKIFIPYAPVGPAADRIADLKSALPIPVRRIIRPHDQPAWPHATRGFFRFKDRIPKLIAGMTDPRAA
ncbi:MAG: hypothetical protein QNJ44_23170 [Rhodobacter sp.]|nr:hypothetical protein [Rhodobacter sp.]